MEDSGVLTDQFLDVVNSSKLFDGVEPDQYVSELKKCQVVVALPYETLISVGDENKNTYFLLSGKFSIHLEKKENPAIRHVEVGETFGELSLLGETKATAFVVARQRCHLLVVPREMMWAFIRQ